MSELSRSERNKQITLLEEECYKVRTTRVKPKFKRFFVEDLGEKTTDNRTRRCRENSKPGKAKNVKS